MAVIDAIPGLQAFIEVGRQQLDEYSPRPEDNTDNEKHTTLYVVTEPGQEFRVVVKRNKSFLLGGPEFDVMCYLHIDGNHIFGMPIHKEQMANATLVFSNRKERSADGRRVKRNFLFSELAFDNNQDPPTSAQAISEAQKMGTIEVRLWRGNYESTTGQKSKVDGRRPTPVGPVHEKALKGRAMSRAVEFGEAQVIAGAPETTDVLTSTKAPAPLKFRKRGKKAFAVFTFKYRSLADLKTELIIPRDPSPGPLEQRPPADFKPELTIPRIPSPVLPKEHPQESLSREEVSGWRPPGWRPRTRAETARFPQESLSREEVSGWRPRTRAETARAKGEAEASQNVKRERSGDDVGDAGETEEIAPQVKRQRVIEMIDLTGD